MEVQSIAAIRHGKSGVEYLIKWKVGGDTWEPEANIMDDDLIDEFEASQQKEVYGSAPIKPGAAVEVKNLDEGFQNSWSGAKVVKKAGNKWLVEYTAFVDAKGKKLSEAIDRSRLRTEPASAGSSWRPRVGDIIEVVEDDCWWEARVQKLVGEKKADVMFRVSDEVKSITLGARVRPCGWLKMASAKKK